LEFNKEETCGTHQTQPKTIRFNGCSEEPSWRVQTTLKAREDFGLPVDIYVLVRKVRLGRRQVKQEGAQSAMCQTPITA
jgi:hypothetical protein